MKKIIHMVTVPGLILLIPLVLTLLAIWHWKPAAFILVFVLLLGAAGILYGMIKKKMLNNKTYRLAVGIAVTAVLILAWMNAAVGGILGDNPANMMYFGVLLTALTGALIAHLEPRGMAGSLFATAFAMILVPSIALITGKPVFTNGVLAVFGLHAFFAMLFAGSALLFRRAAREHTVPGIKPTV